MNFRAFSRSVMLLGLMLPHGSKILAQAAPPPERIVSFQEIRLGNAHFRFEPQPPPLIQIAGAPEAFWTYYWEFGDGSFSFDEFPEHHFPGPKVYDVGLWATGNYDNGDPPTSKDQRVHVTNPPDPGAPTTINTLFDSREEEGLVLRAIRDPRPNEPLVIIGSYENLTAAPQAGQLYFFFNEQAAGVEHFAWQEARTHHGENIGTPRYSLLRPVGTSGGWAGTQAGPYLATSRAEADLQRAYATYQEAKVWDTGTLQPAERRNWFMSLLSTEKMAADTHAFITLEAFYVPDDPALDYEHYELVLEIVAAHDPNHIAVSDVRANFRRVSNRALTYKVRFQNNGEGPAGRIEVTCEVPPGLDPASLEVVDVAPYCPLCPQEEELTQLSCLDTFRFRDRVVFVFNNVYLPGSRQEGVSDRDSTKGFVSYSLRATRALEKRSFGSQASIVFDKEPPIVTNFSSTRFKPGLSPGVMLGYAWRPVNGVLEGQYPMLGFSLAPYSPYRAFPQAEIWFGGGSTLFEEQVIFQGTDTTLINNPGEPTVLSVDNIRRTLLEERTWSLYLAPIQLRKNFSGWLGGGLGVGFDVNFIRSRQEEMVINRRFSQETGEPIGDPILTTDEIEVSETTFTPELFADLQIGRPRVGPALGVRYGLGLAEEVRHRLMVYASWKF